MPAATASSASIDQLCCTFSPSLAKIGPVHKFCDKHWRPTIIMTMSCRKRLRYLCLLDSAIFQFGPFTSLFFHLESQDLGQGRLWTPDQIISFTQRKRCPSIAYSYNEPSMFLEFGYDCMKKVCSELLCTVLQPQHHHCLSPQHRHVH